MLLVNYNGLKIIGYWQGNYYFSATVLYWLFIEYLYSKVKEWLGIARDFFVCLFAEQ